MRRRDRMRYAFLCCILAFMLAFPAYATKTEVSVAQKKVDSLEEEKKKVENTIKDLQGLKQDAAAYVKKLDESLEVLEQELEKLAAQVSAKEQDITAAQSELDAAGKIEVHQYESMKLRMKYMYEKGDTGYLDLLLQSEDVSQFLNRAEYIAKISEYDRKMLEQYAATKAEIAEKEMQLELEHEELLGMQQASEAKQISVEALMSEKSTELKNFESKINSAEGQLDAYEKDIKVQEDKIKQMESEIRRKEEEARKAALAAGQKYNTVSIGNIKFIWPCPSSSKINSGFGGREAPTEGASTNHQGIDIGAPSGSNIIAAAAGEVIISTYSYSAGNYIMINHGGGVYTVYMHCSQLLASVGQQINQGQVIAKVGSTGYSTGPHLHFGIRVGGNYANPVNYVSP